MQTALGLDDGWMVDLIQTFRHKASGIIGQIDKSMCLMPSSPHGIHVFLVVHRIWTSDPLRQGLRWQTLWMTCARDLAWPSELVMMIARQLRGLFTRLQQRVSNIKQIPTITKQPRI